jgi:hypothetical protein
LPINAQKIVTNKLDNTEDCNEQLDNTEDCNEQLDNTEDCNEQLDNTEDCNSIAGFYVFVFPSRITIADCKSSERFFVWSDVVMAPKVRIVTVPLVGDWKQFRIYE